MPEHVDGKNKEIRHDLIETANYLHKLADTLANSHEIIDGKFKIKRDVRRIFKRADKKLEFVIEQISKDDIFRDIIKTTAREILRKMRKYMLYLFKLERQRKEKELFLEVKDA